MSKYGIEFVRTTSNIDIESAQGLIDEDCIESFHNEMKMYYEGHCQIYIAELSHLFEIPDCIRLKCKVFNSKSETSLMLRID